MLIQGNCVKLFVGRVTPEEPFRLSGELEARAGESLLIRRIETYQTDPFGESGDTDIILKTDRVTTGVYRIWGKTGNHIETVRTAQHKFNIMEFLEKRGVNVALPVAEGQVFSWSTTAEVRAIVIMFDRYAAGDMVKSAPNGSESKEYVFMQYMNVGTGLDAAGDALFNLSLSPAEFPDFPCGKVVPARHKISVLGLVGCPWCDGAVGVQGFYTTHIKLVKEREVLFDIDRNGIPFHSYSTNSVALLRAAGYSLIGSGQYTLGGGHGGQGDPLMFEPPLDFASGEELNIYAKCTAYGAAPVWTSTAPDLAAILKVVKE